MSEVLRRWNVQDGATAAREVLSCCGSDAWAAELTALRPFVTVDDLLEASDRVWWRLPEAAWLAAFISHPRIGERVAAAGKTTAESLRWSEEEQHAAGFGGAAALEAANHLYEQRFGRMFIVCAAGLSAGEILANLDMRMSHDAATELRVAAEEQRQITQLRLKRWLEGR